MHPSFWHDRWHSGQIGFHQAEVNPYLVRFWPQLQLTRGQRVFVPLCGKSRDMVWLAEQGHPIVGNEISPIAIREFFSAAGLTPSISDAGHLRRWTAAGYELLEGDYFALSRSDLGRIDAVYDRAALIAMPSSLRPRYAARLVELTPPEVPMLLVAMNYDESRMSGPPFAVTHAEVEALFEKTFVIELLHTEDALAANPRFRERGLERMEESVWLLRRGRDAGARL